MIGKNENNKIKVVQPQAKKKPTIKILMNQTIIAIYDSNYIQVVIKNKME